jgi:formylglycine-generating enzyme required for sulfatase activity
VPEQHGKMRLAQHSIGSTTDPRKAEASGPATPQIGSTDRSRSESGEQWPQSRNGRYAPAYGARHLPLPAAEISVPCRAQATVPDNNYERHEAGVAPPSNETLQRLRVFLSSPSDVADERGLARAVLRDLPKEPQFQGRLALEEVSWDAPGAGAPLAAHLTPQEAINQRRAKPSDCDIVLVILWARMGTPLPPDYTKPDGTPYLSGTEWEYFDAIEAAEKHGRPQVFVYWRTDKVWLDPDAPDFDEATAQRRRVQQFFEAFQAPDGSLRRSYHTFATPSEFADMLEDHLREIIWGSLSVVLGGSGQEAAVTEAGLSEPLWRGSPYPGLRAFVENEGPIFCGRCRETDGLVRSLAQERKKFLAVVGASGAGKSSLVAAGLLPRLRAGAIAGSQDWIWVRLTPGEIGTDPFVALAASLAHRFQVQGWVPRDLATQLREEPAAFARAVRQALPRDKAWVDLVLFVDQFEELFTVVDADRIRPFIDWLDVAADTPGVRIIVTLRADFYTRCIECPPLADLLKKGTYPLAPPGPGGLQAMIAEPAERAGLLFEDGLVGRILDDAGTSTGALPLMAFALAELYKRRSGARLTHAAYEDFEGVKGAIGTQAEQTFEGFARKHPKAEDALTQVFRELLVVDEQGTPTRRRVPKANFTQTPVADGLVDALTQARLLVCSRGEGGSPSVEVAHEALFSHWRRLARWIEQRKNDLRLLLHLREGVDEWEKQKYRHAYLWPESRAHETSNALERLQREADEREAAFLDPVQRLKYLLARDAQAWERAGRNPKRLWTFEQFAGFSDITAASLGGLSTQEQAFILQSFTTQLALLRDEPRKRARMGDVLAGLDDPRFRPDRWYLPNEPLLGFVEVPGGPFQMGSDRAKDPEAYADELPQHAVKLPAFFIARYPVTVAQFTAFVEASGYQPRESDYAKGAPNHPVVWVTWQDAIAYGRWLQEGLRALATEPETAATAEDPAVRRFWEGLAGRSLGVGLPSEAEWEKAARGSDGRRYPWGEKPDPRQANYKDAGIGATSAVGCFPEGAGPFGCCDMSGNVWEWTRSLWGKSLERQDYPYPYNTGRRGVRRWFSPGNGRENLEAPANVRRVLRGGALYNLEHFVRCAHRAPYDPNYRRDSVGMRVVVSPFFSDR